MQTINPYLVIDGASQAIDFYKSIFGAKELYRLSFPGSDKVAYAELTIKESTLMLSDEVPNRIKSPVALGGTPVRISVVVEDVDGVLEKAIEAGATVINQPQNHFYGHRSASFRDPFGHEWLCTHEFEVVTPEEMQRRLNEMMSKE